MELLSHRVPSSVVRVRAAVSVTVALTVTVRRLAWRFPNPTAWLRQMAKWGTSVITWGLGSAH